jgi:hypothetical protein
LCAARGSLANVVDGAGKIFVGVAGAAHLHQTDRKFVGHIFSLTSSASGGEGAIPIANFRRWRDDGEKVRVNGTNS